MDLLALASVGGGLTHGAIQLAQEEGAQAGLQINLFWVIVSSLNFIVFAVVLYWLFGAPLGRMLAERRTRVEEGLRDADEARKARAAAEEARREANEILTRSQKVADESRERDLAATREELERIRTRASAELEAEKQRAIGELRAEVADLALRAAGRVVGETMTDDRQRRLVKEFLDETADGTSSSKERNG